MDENILRRFIENPAQAVKLSQVGVITPVYSEGRVYAVNMGLPFCVFELPENELNSEDAKEYLDLAVEDIISSAAKAKEENKYFWYGKEFDYKKRLKSKREKAEEERRKNEERARLKQQREKEEAERKAIEDKIRKEQREALYKIGEAREQLEKTITSFCNEHIALNKREQLDAAFLIWLKDAHEDNYRITKTGTAAKFADITFLSRVYAHRGTGKIAISRTFLDSNWVAIGTVKPINIDNPSYAKDTISECIGLGMLVPSAVPSGASTWNYWTFDDDLKNLTGVQIAEMFIERKRHKPIKSFNALKFVSAREHPKYADLLEEDIL